MRSALISLGAAKLGGVVLPFPDIADPPASELPALPDAVAAPVAAVVEAPKEDTVAPWTAPTMEPDQFAASADAFKHPSAAVVKDWETAPKVEIFEPLPPAPDMPKPKKEAEVALPVVHSQLQPIITSQRDDDPELSAIQQENPLAYGIVKALLLKKSMGLPLPGAEAVQHHTDAGMSPEAAIGSSGKSIGNMWNWKPAATATDGADDELAAVEQSETVSKVPEPEVAEEPAEPKVEVAAVEPEPQAPAPEEQAAPAAAPSMDSGNALGSFLGSSAPAAPVVVHEAAKPAAAPASGVLASYMNDLD